MSGSDSIFRSASSTKHLSLPMRFSSAFAAENVEAFDDWRRRGSFHPERWADAALAFLKGQR